MSREEDLKYADLTAAIKRRYAVQDKEPLTVVLRAKRM